MGPKLLFLFGIVVAHGAVGAAWLSQDPPAPQATASGCGRPTEPHPHFQPKAEMLAMWVAPIPAESQALP
jgi:hypothetical protein